MLCLSYIERLIHLPTRPYRSGSKKSDKGEGGDGEEYDLVTDDEGDNTDTEQGEGSVYILCALYQQTTALNLFSLIPIGSFRG